MMKTIGPRLLIAVLLCASARDAYARPHSYPPVRYISESGLALGGVTLPLADELGNSLFNNPAALARNTKFRSEFLNLNLDSNSNLLGGIGLDTLKMTSLNGMAATLNSHTNQIYSAGLTNTTAVQWGGLAVGVLFTEQVRAASDGTNIRYNTVSQLVPAVGYGVALARGVVRLGYSIQYVNQSAGSATTLATNGSASFLEGINEGRGLSHTASVNFIFPFTYLPTFSVLARNIFGTHYVSGSLLGRASNPAGITSDEPMSVDGAFNWVVRFSGSTKSNWYFQFQDMFSSYSMPFLERLSLGVDIGISPSFDLRVGMNGSQWSAGIGFKSESSEINLSMYHEPSPIAGTEYWDTRFGLQYKIFFQDVNTRDREREQKQ